LKTFSPRSNKTVDRIDLFIRQLSRGAAIAACVLCLVACKPRQAPVPVAPPEEPARVSHDEDSKALPPDLDKNMPIYPGAVVEHVRKPKGAMREIMFSSDATLAQMVAFYKEELKKNDYHITSALIMPARKTWSCDFNTKGRPGSIMLFPSDANKARMIIDLIYELPAKMDPSLLEPTEDYDVVGPGEVAQQNKDSNPTEKAKRN
jgi:hypothetical protein